MDLVPEDDPGSVEEENSEEDPWHCGDDGAESAGDPQVRLGGMQASYYSVYKLVN